MTITILTMIIMVMKTMLGLGHETMMCAVCLSVFLVKIITATLNTNCCDIE